MMKRRLFLTYIALGAALLFFVYSLNAIYVDKYGFDDTAPADLSADIRPPNPFPQGKPDVRRKKQEEEEKRRKDTESRKNEEVLSNEKMQKQEEADRQASEKDQKLSTTENKSN